MTCNNRIPGNCCGCQLSPVPFHDLTPTETGGTLTVGTDGRTTLAGEFTGPTVAAEAYTIVAHDFTGSFSFDIDGRTYSIEQSGDTVTITADGNTNVLVRTLVGNVGTVLTFQIRLTPTHAFILAAETTEDSPAIAASQIQLRGGLYTIVTAPLTAPPSPEWTLTADGTFDTLHVASSQTTFDTGADDTQPPRRNCFVAPLLTHSYQAYRVLVGSDQNEIDYPLTVFADVSIDRDPSRPDELDGRSGGTGPGGVGSVTIITTDGTIRSGRRNFGDAWIDGLVLHGTDGIAGNRIFAGTLANQFGGFNTRQYNTSVYDNSDDSLLSSTENLRFTVPAVRGSIVLLWPDPTASEPYPLPVYWCTANLSAEFFQPRSGALWVWLYSSAYDAPAPSAELYLAINDLDHVAHTLTITDADTFVSIASDLAASQPYDPPYTQFDGPITAQWHLTPAT